MPYISIESGKLTAEQKKELIERLTATASEITHMTEIDEVNGGRNQLAQRRGEIMQNLRNCGFEKRILLESYSNLSSVWLRMLHPA